MKKRTLLMPRIKTYTVFLFVVLLLFVGCKTETLFQSNFDNTGVGQQPAHVQKVGTANLEGPVGAVTVVASPVATGGKWIQVKREQNNTSVSAFQGVLSKVTGEGEFTFTSTLFIPSGAEVVTLQMEAQQEQIAFLHLDFTQNNQVRLDDNDSTTFGSFPRDQAFLIQVTLNVTASATTAHIVLSGADASGTSDYTLKGALANFAKQFFAVRVWMGFPWAGSFDATNIVVQRKVK